MPNGSVWGMEEWMEGVHGDRGTSGLEAPHQAVIRSLRIDPLLLLLLLLIHRATLSTPLTASEKEGSPASTRTAIMR